MDALIKQCILFEIFLQFSLPPSTYTMLKLGKKFWMQTSSVVCGVWVGGGGEGLGKGELTKRLTSANVSQDFCP